MSRWNRLLETKPLSLIDHLLTEMAKLIAQDLSTWPLPIQELDPALSACYREVIAAESRPADGVFAEAFRLTRWELKREVDAIDEYMRNLRWMSFGLSSRDKAPILFVARWLLEQYLSLLESTNSRITRVDLLECLERTQRFFTQLIPSVPAASESLKKRLL